MAPLIYVINLDRDAERLASVRGNLVALGLSFERIPAVIGKELPDWRSHVDMGTYAWRNRQDEPRPGEVGCYLSHLKAMETFLRTDAPWCVILEDDVEVLPACAEVLRALAEKEDWDLVKLFNFHSGLPVKKRALGAGHHLVAHLTRTTSSAAYVVNRRAAETLLKSMLPISEQVDHALDRPWETGLRIRGIRPMPVVLAPVATTTSTIGYQDTNRANRTLAKSFRLFLSRARKEVSRFSYALLEYCLR
jgi:glycosyl transferase, family 25